jgi:hypothetical protein
LTKLGWTHHNLMKEEPGAANPTGRLSFRDLIVPVRLRIDNGKKDTEGKSIVVAKYTGMHTLRHFYAS